MNNILNLIQKYNKQGIIFIVKNDNLTIKTEKGSVCDEILLEIKNKKHQIINFFKNHYKVLSFAQERLWFIDQYAHNDSYNILSAIRLSGKLNINFLEKTFFEIIRRHEILRTNIVTINNVASQIIHEESKFELEIVDQSHLEEETANQKIQELIEIESQKPFDLANDSLIRLILFKINDKDHTLFLNQHHIITDGWSFNIFLNEISLIYMAFSKNMPSPLPKLEIQYGDYAVWQREHFVGEVLTRKSEYWKNKLSGTGFLELPTDNPRPAEQTFNGAGLSFSLDKSILDKLNAFSRNNDVTLFMTLLSVFNVLLHKYTGQDDICIGTPIANRTRSEIEPLIGFFANTLALRSDLSGGISFIDLVQQVKQTTLEAYDNQDIPFEKVVDIIQPERTLAYNPLFQVVMVLQNNPESEFSMGELCLKPVDMDLKVTKFDFTINFIEKAEGLVVGIEYNTDLFNKARIYRMIEHFKVLFNSIVTNPEQKISNISIIPPEEKQKLLVERNNTKTGYPKDKCIHQLFEEQVRKKPNSIALVFEGQQLTYKELNVKSNQLANYIQEKGVKPDSLVGICVDRSLEMIVGLLGILKAGGAYVPIDPTYPEDRVSYMLEDADCEIVLTQAHIELPETNSEIIYLDGDWNKIKNESTENVKSEVKSANLAYVIYTSGSTGRPKGTLIEHRNVVRLLFNDKFQFSFSEKDVWSLFHSFCFDFSVWEMYGALLYGGKLIVISKETTKDIEQFSEILEKHKITVLNQTPSVFYNLSDVVERNKTVLTVRYVIFGAEALKPAKLRYWYEKYPTCKLINMYGITETTVHVTYKEITRHEIENNTCNIGKPIPTLSAYILDENQNLQPIGVPGELCVSGAGLSRGYLNNEKLTAAKFRNNPFAEGEKIYHSGDLAYINETGELIYCGRIDNQIKIRGFRIELGEIEAAINKMETIKDFVVVAKEDASGNNRLVAYLVSDEELNVQEIRKSLSKSLPDYMVPSFFVKLEKMPLTPNGKVDRKALPEPEGNLEITNEYVAPRNEIEKKIVELWSKFLGVGEEKIGINESFFSIGGDSIKAVRMLNQTNNLLNTKLKISDLYSSQTVGLLAEKINILAKDKNEILEIKKVKEEIEGLKKRIINDDNIPEKNNIEDIYPMSDIEKGMLYSSLMNPELSIYHDQITYQIKYTNFSFERFKNALSLVVDKHQNLRSSFNMDDYEEAVKIVYKETKLDIKEIDISKNDEESQKKYITEFLEKDRKKPFNYLEAPIWRMRIFSIGSENLIIILSVHHSILDGWSVASFMTEINNTYFKLESNKDYVPDRLKSSCKDYIIDAKYAENNNEAHEYWKNKLLDYKRVVFPPVPKEKIGTGSLKVTGYNLGKKMLKDLEKVAARYNTSIKHLCFAAYAYMINMLSYENDIVVGLVTNNRPVIDDGDKLLGCFLNTVPFRVKVPKKISWKEYINEIEKELVELKKFDKLSLLKIKNIVAEQSRDENPFFDILFNYVDFHIYNEAQIEKIDANSGNTKESDLGIEGYENTNTLFNFEVSNTFGEFLVRLSYSDKFMTDEDAHKLKEYYVKILNKFIELPEKNIHKNEIILETEKNYLLGEWNNTARAYPKDKTLSVLFEEQVIKTPENIALIFGNDELTYTELNKRSNKLAYYLIAKGVKPGNCVGITTARGFDMIIGMMAILKSGGTYVPIDPEYPLERKEYIINNSGIELVLQDQDYNLTCKKRITIKPSTYNNYSQDNPGIRMQANDLAYVIYTSGSTGLPKGVMIENHSIVNLIHWVNSRFNINEKDRLLFITSMCFDLSVYDIFGILSSGASVVIATKEQVQEPEQLMVLMKEKQITFWDSVPSTFNYILDIIQDKDWKYKQEELRLVFMSGDWIPVNLPGKIKKYFPNANQISLGGATEGTVWSNYYPIDLNIEYKNSIPYGKPIDNTSFYILDQNQNLVPYGVIGELYIGGVGVAAGYICDEEKTRNSFVKDIYKGSGKQKMYRTGDYGRMLPDGNMEFIGRKDDQVKVRGYRVELGEIENVLLKYKDISTSVVVIKESSYREKEIVAYFVSAEELEITEIRAYLTEVLPDYMIPSYFIQIESIPLTANGKVDRKAFPDVNRNEISQVEYVQPSTETEKKLATIWQDVLNIESVGIHDNFFDLGGHSLLATRVISKIRNEFKIELPLKTLFENTDLESFSEIINNTLSVSEISKIAVAKRNTYLPLSFAQERLWFIDQYEHNAIYNLPGAVKLIGKLNINVLEKTFFEIIRRHEILRTNIVTLNNVTSQYINEEPKFELKIVDQSHLTEEAADQKIQELIEIESQKPFDLENDSLVRIILYKIKDDEYTLFVNKHHIISDGWSFSIFINEITILYKAFNENKPSPLPELEIQYADYAIWQRVHINGEILNNQSNYWRNKLTGTAILELPTDNSRPSEQTFNGANLPFTLDKDITEKLGNFSKVNDVTLFMTLLSAFKVLLNKYTGQDDICVGSPIANRTRSEIEPLIGFFVNTLALRSDLSRDICFTDLVEKVKQTTLEAYTNQDIPFEKVVDIVQPERNLSYSPLFQVMMSFQNNPESEKSFGELSLNPIEFEFNISKFDLTVNLTETQEGLVGGIEYNTDIFHKERIERMIRHFKVLLKSIIFHPTAKISELEILTPAEKQKIVVDWNDTQVNYPTDKCIHEIFESQVEKTPDKVAVVFEENQLTYRELNEKSNQLAHYLNEKRVKPDTLVGICVDRSLEMIIGLLGILKAGSAYVPIDPTYPRERILYMLEDADCGMVLSQSHIELPKTNSEVIYLDTNWEKIKERSIENVKSGVTSENLAYVIYTSGSTGNPKGVMNQHNGIVNRLYWTQDTFKLEQEDVILQKTTYSFDVSVWELFWPIIVGSKLVFAKPEGHKDNVYLIETIKKEKVTTIHFVPSMLSTMLDTEGIEECVSLKRVLCSGEALSYKLTEQFYKKMGQCTLHNLYGPTEAAVDVSYFPCEKYRSYTTIPIGKPVSNTELYILDKNDKIVPVGVPGELYIGGVQVARGYMKKPELTAEKFIKNPYSEDPNSRLYKTGDLVRYLPDGNIEFLGRIDNQVKIRGFRIELGEIEAAINKIPTIKESVVVAKEDASGNNRLVAYLVSGEDINIQELREELSKTLPDYMVPSLYVKLEEMPLTPNGKVDRKSLPDPEGNIETTNEYVSPRNEIEQKLAGIWGKVLGIENVGVYDNFFELGGDSIITTQIVSRASQEQIIITPRDIFKYQTIATLAKISRTNELNIIAEQGLISGEIPLTPIQSWFFEEDFENKNHWNQAIMLKVKDSVDISILENTINALVQQHDVLRLFYSNEKGQWLQKHNELMEYKLEVVDFSHLTGNEVSKLIEDHANRIQGSLSIENGKLFKAALFKTNNHNELLIAINHLVVDGVSWRILIEDIQKACMQQINKKEIDLDLKTSSFKQWSERLTKYTGSEKLTEELEYWENIVSKPNTSLPLDNKGDNTGESTKNVIVKLNKKITGQLLKEAGQAYKTEINDLLLTGLAIIIERWTKNENIIINLEGHGREDLFNDTNISRTVGWFTAQFPVCLTLEKDNDIADTIKSIKEQLRGIPNKGIGYGILRYLHPEKSVRKRLSLKTNNDISFNYLGQFNNIQENSDLITMSSQSVGESISKTNHRTHIIDINSLISNGELVISWSYSENKHEKETIEKIAYSYVEELQHIVEHCLHPESKGYTPSDFPLCQISQKDLDEVTMNIDNEKFTDYIEEVEI